MDRNTERNELFRTSQMMILVAYTVLSIMLILESVLMSWEKWALVLIVAGVAICWVLHISNTHRKGMINVVIVVLLENRTCRSTVHKIKMDSTRIIIRILIDAHTLNIWDDTV